MTGAILLNFWRSHEALTLNEPATPEEIHQFEERHNVQLPEEVHDYYRAANGFAPPGDLDENGFCFWPLKRVSPVDGIWLGEGCEHCFIFADYLLSSWAYAFRLTTTDDPARVCIVGTASGRPRWIAESFREFIELYVRDDARLYSANAAL